MDRFVAPQFIDVEDRIIGPITTRQFVMIIIGGVVAFASYKFFDTALFVLVSFLVSVSVILFGFVKINGRYLAPFLKSMIESLKRPSKRVWYKNIPASILDKNKEGKSDSSQIVDKNFVSKRKIEPKSLSQLALLVDTGGKFGDNIQVE